MPVILNMKDPGWRNVPGEWVYVGRPSIFGNPYSMKDNSQAERDRVCDMFDYDVANSPSLQKLALTLKGKNLVCYCYPKRCHAETWLKYANNED